MAITFPRTTPDELLIAGQSFFLEPMIERTPLRSGAQIMADTGASLWKTTISAENLDPARGGVVRAWRSTLASGQAFYAYDKAREYPLAYALGWGNLLVSGAAFNGTGMMTTVNANSVEPTITFVPAGFVLSPGDYLSFGYGDSKQALHMVVAPAVANGSGIIIPEVRPYIRPGWYTPVTTIQFYRPLAKMLMVPGSWRESTKPPVLFDVSFEAIQSL